MKETLPRDEIIRTTEFKMRNTAKTIEELLPPDFRYLVDNLISSAWSVGALRVVDKAGNQAQILLEGRVK